MTNTPNDRNFCGENESKIWYWEAQYQKLSNAIFRGERPVRLDFLTETFEAQLRPEEIGWGYTRYAYDPEHPCFFRSHDVDFYERPYNVSAEEPLPAPEMRALLKKKEAAVAAALPPEKRAAFEAVFEKITALLKIDGVC